MDNMMVEKLDFLMVELMVGKLSLHAAFSGAATERLKMCSDCRVVDMMNKPNDNDVV